MTFAPAHCRPRARGLRGDLARLLVPAALLAVAATSAFADGDGSFDANRRIENEYKLDVPDDLADEVWAYLRTRYPDAGATVLAAFGGVHRARFSVEYFRDTYLDTRERRLLALRAGVRHRRRTIPHDTTDAKHGRELVQVKLSGVDSVTRHRVELKFEPRPLADGRAEAPAAVLERIDRDDRARFTAACRELGVRAQELGAALGNAQTRRRVYLSIDGADVATISLDRVCADQGWWSAVFHEVEIEIDEATYTQGTPEQRARLDTMIGVIADDLRARFPRITQDQTPKYNKSQARLADPRTRTWTPAGDVAIVLGSVALLMAGAWLTRRRVGHR